MEELVKEQGNLVEKSFNLLFTGRKFPYAASIKYSGHFKDYGAAIALRGNMLTLKLSSLWRDVSEEIKIGLIQSLLLRLFKRKYGITKKHQINSFHIDLYSSFVRNLHKTIPKEMVNPLLKESFDRVDEKYFYSMIEMPNLVIADYSSTKFGSYDFKTDTLSISQSIVNDHDLLDYVMYHEMLHKKHSFRQGLGKNSYHTADFRKAEKDFENSEELERRLSYIASKNFVRKRISSANPFAGKSRKGILGFLRKLLD